MSIRMFFLLFTISAVAAFAQGDGSQAATPDPAVSTAQARLEQIRLEFQNLNAELQEIQREAMRAETVREKGDEFHRALQAEMMDIAPDEMEGKVKQRFRLAEKLEDSASNPPATQQEQQALMRTARDLEQLIEEVSSYEEEAVQKASVMSLRREYVAAISAAMEAVDPEYPKMVERQQELAREYREVQQDLKAGGG